MKKIEGFVKNSNEIPEIQNNKNLPIEERILKVREIFYSLQGEGGRAGEASIFIRLAYCNKNCWFCFGVQPGKYVPKINTVNEGKKNITDIKIGDKLLTFNDNQELVETEVTDLIEREVDEWYEVKINGKVYRMTPEHPLFTKRGLISAEDLVLNDIILHTDRSEIMSYKMKRNNPMFNKDVVDKAMSKKDYKEIIKKSTKTRKENFEKGLFSMPLMSEELKQSHRERMLTDKNPMKNSEVVKSVKQKWKESFSKGEIDLSWSEERKQAQREKMLTDKNPMKNPDVVKKNFLSHNISKSGVEMKFEKWCEQEGIDIKYIGDGSFPIVHKFPDFIKPGSNKLFEIYCSTFPYNGGKRDANWVDKKVNYYKKHGYDCLCVDMDSPKEQNMNEVRAFLHNGYEVQEIKYVNINDEETYKKKRPDKLKVYNLSCAPYNTYLVDNFWSHNCDTDWSFGTEMKIKDILKEIDQYKCDWIVWTGGEPTLQVDEDIVEYFDIHGFLQAIETNGTNPVPEGINYVVCSPKVKPDILNKNFASYDVDEFRYPYEKTKIPNIDDLPIATHYFISPLFDGKPKEKFEIDKHAVEEVIQYVKDNPEWKLSIQMHKILGIR